MKFLGHDIPALATCIPIKRKPCKIRETSTGWSLGRNGRRAPAPFQPNPCLESVHQTHAYVKKSPEILRLDGPAGMLHSLNEVPTSEPAPGINGSTEPSGPEEPQGLAPT
jgi:hypothetical protein